MHYIDNHKMLRMAKILNMMKHIDKHGFDMTSLSDRNSFDI